MKSEGNLFLPGHRKIVISFFFNRGVKGVRGGVQVLRTDGSGMAVEEMAEGLNKDRFALCLQLDRRVRADQQAGYKGLGQGVWGGGTFGDGGIDRVCFVMSEWKRAAPRLTPKLKKKCLEKSSKVRNQRRSGQENVTIF